MLITVGVILLSWSHLSMTVSQLNKSGFSDALSNKVTTDGFWRTTSLTMGSNLTYT